MNFTGANPRMRRFFKFIAFISATLFLLVCVSALAVYHLIRVGEVRRFLIDEIERRTELRAQLGAAELEIGWTTGVVFHDLVLSEPGAAQPAIETERITARVALIPLLRRRLVFYEIRAERPAVRLARDKDGRFPLLEKLLNLPFLDQQESEYRLDLRSLRIDRGDIALADQSQSDAPVQWRLSDAAVRLERLRGQSLTRFLQDVKGATAPHQTAALSFDVRGGVIRAGARMDLRAQGRFAFAADAFRLDEASWAAELDVVNLPAALIKEYLGARSPVAAASGRLRPRLHIQGSLSRSLRLQGAAEFRGLALEAPGLLAAPLRGADGRINFDLDWNQSRLHATRIDLHAKDLKFSLEGEIIGMNGEDPRVSLRLSGMSAPIVPLLRHLPLDPIISGEWKHAFSSIQSGQIEVTRATIEAPLTQLRRLKETGPQAIRLEAAVRNVTANPGADTTPLRGVEGKITLRDGIFGFDGFRGAYGNSRLIDVSGHYNLTPGEFGRLEAQIFGDLDLAELKERVTPRLPAHAGQLISSMQDVQGRGKVEIEVRRVPEKPLAFAAKVALDRVHLRSGEISLNDLQGDVAITPTGIRSGTLRAQLHDAPVQIRLALDRYSEADGTFDLAIDSTGIRAGVVSRLLLDSGDSRDRGIVRGSIRYTGSFRDRSARKLTGKLDLFNVQLAVEPLLQPLRELSGRVSIDEEGIDFENLRALLAGFPAAASGRWYYAGKPQLFFEFTAPNLDITYLLSQIDAESSQFYANLVAHGKITLGKGRVKNFDFSELSTDVTLNRRVWRLSRLSARSAGGAIEGLTTIFDRPESLTIHAEPKIRNVPMTSFLNWFDLATTEMTGSVSLDGQLETSGQDDAERKQNLNGAFNLRIEDGTIHRMRVLVQILNLLDLSRWFTLQLPDLTKQGIRFRSITGDFKVTQGVYATENLVVDSSDLRMTGAGKIDVPRDVVDFVVAVRPFADIDSAITQIPLLGRGIAAIKNSFLVASFNIKGPIDDPTITPAPLGTLSEMFWSILGIPKNAVGLDDRETREAPVK